MESRLLAGDTLSSRSTSVSRAEELDEKLVGTSRSGRAGLQASVPGVLFCASERALAREEAAFSGFSKLFSRAERTTPEQGFTILLKTPISEDVCQGTTLVVPISR